MSALILRRYYHVTLILLIILVGSVGFIFLMRPALEDFRLARNQEKGMSDRLESVEMRLKQVHQLEGQVKSGAPSDIEKLKSMFISTPELAYVGTILQTHSQAAHFLMTALNVGTNDRTPVPDVGVQISDTTSPEELAKATTTVAIAAQFKGGGYPELKELLGRITRAVPILELSSFTFDAKNTAVAVNLTASVIQQDLRHPMEFDAGFFSSPQFKALGGPLTLPNPDPVGKENPFGELPKVDNLGKHP